MDVSDVMLYLKNVQVIEFHSNPCRNQAESLKAFKSTQFLSNLELYAYVQDSRRLVCLET